MESTVSLRSRFILFIVLFGVVAVVTLVLFFNYHIDSMVKRQVREQTETLASSLDWAIAPLLNSRSTKDVQRLIENIGSCRQIELIRVYDRSGTIVASSRSGEIGEVKMHKTVKNVLNSQLLYDSTEDLRDELFVYSVPIRGTEYVTTMGTNISHVLYIRADVHYLQTGLGVLVRSMLVQNIILFLLLALVMFFFFTRRVLRPLRIFMNATAHLENGEFQQRVEINSNDEFAVFAKLFNSMEEEIEEKKQHLANYSEKLEHLVDERTQELSRSLKELEKANETILQQEKLASIGQLSAGIAHEINNPVGYVMSNLDTLSEYLQVFSRILEIEEKLEDSLLSENDEAALKMVADLREIKHSNDLNFILEDTAPLLDATIQGTKRIRDIVGDLRNFARMDDFSFEEIDVNKAIKKALKISWNELKYTCDVETRLGDLPPVLANQMQLTQVFINILVNAAQSIDSSGTVRVESETDDDVVTVRISDTGSGMPAEIRSKIFDPFFTTKDIGNGTGMGLSISQGIIQRHGGTIEVESIVGEGSTFIVTIPLKTTEENA
ncbi:MAG: HAMP domain-containing protein [Spirochaetales bacterium]|nr:HAMP domain-containing protein [Spirochaetales bacterium]MCF7938290.1 HAMP domain-containing protein [Spirochaetales bacterium]